MPSERSACSTQSSRNAYESAKRHARDEGCRHVERVRDDRVRRHQHRAAARDAADDVEAVALRRPRGRPRCAATGTMPMTTADSSHSHRRSVGRRRPSPTRPVSTSSSARFMRGETGALVHDLPVEVAPSRRRHERTAHGGADGLGREARAAARPRAAPRAPPRRWPRHPPRSGSPLTAASMSSSASSGSRKKSPARWKSAMRPSRSSRSTTTSFPPGTLYSPCMGPA